jgi:predicted phosphatase
MSFDDHPTVVVLEEIIRRILKAECRQSPDPDSQLREWAAWLKERGELYEAVGWREGQTAHSTLNAIEIAVAFDTFAEELLAPES